VHIRAFRVNSPRGASDAYTAPTILSRDQTGPAGRKTPATFHGSCSSRGRGRIAAPEWIYLTRYLVMGSVDCIFGGAHSCSLASATAYRTKWNLQYGNLISRPARPAYRYNAFFSMLVR